MKVKVTDPAELDALLDDAAYAKRCEDRALALPLS